MRPVVSIVTNTLAALAIAALPATGFAQTQSAQPNPAAEHLAAARAALNKVLNAPAPTGDAFKILSQIKTDYIALEKAASTASPDWAARYATIDRLITELLGAPAASGEPGAVGTSGRAGAAKIDAGLAADLETFRTELKAFSSAMSPAAPAASASASSAAPTSAPAPASPSTPASGSVVAGTAPKAAPIPAPAAPAAASASPASSAPSSSAPPAATPATAAAPPSADASVGAQIDPVIALIDAALAANPVDASGKVTVDRATLDAIKAQLQVIKAKKP